MKLGSTSLDTCTDKNPSVFKLEVLKKFGGDYWLANGYGSADNEGRELENLGIFTLINRDTYSQPLMWLLDTFSTSDVSYFLTIFVRGRTNQDLKI